MSTSDHASEPVSDRLHPLIYIAAATLLAWFVVASWLLFDDVGYISLALAMISVLVFMFVMIPTALWRVSARRNVSADVIRTPPQPLAAWLRGELVTWTGPERSLAAAIEILLPIVGITVAFTTIGVLFALTRAGVL